MAASSSSCSTSCTARRLSRDRRSELVIGPSALLVNGPLAALDHPPATAHRGGRIAAMRWVLVSVIVILSLVYLLTRDVTGPFN
jgi:hypothetical protein